MRFAQSVLIQRSSMDGQRFPLASIIPYSGISLCPPLYQRYWCFMTTRTLAIIQARMSSTRLPGKVLRDLCGKPMLARQIERISACKLIDILVVATSVDASDNPVADLCADLGILCHRGPLDDVLGRFSEAALRFGPPEHVVRLTGDCPLSDPTIIDACIGLHLANGADYTSNCVVRTYPKGLDVEVVTYAALEAAVREARTAYEREHVTPFIIRQPERFRQERFMYSTDLSALRWVVDTPADFDFAKKCL